jgi:NAD(P)-dependent dehydrogenase (short-subunit alcohol dehydrogenase family)
VLAVEHRDTGVCFYNLEPGFVMTEAMKLNDPDGALEKLQKAAPMTVPAAVVRWLASDPAAREWNGQTVHAQKFALQHGLHEDWR